MLHSESAPPVSEPVQSEAGPLIPRWPPLPDGPPPSTLVNNPTECVEARLTLVRQQLEDLNRAKKQTADEVGRLMVQCSDKMQELQTLMRRSMRLASSQARLEAERGYLAGLAEERVAVEDQQGWQTVKQDEEEEEEEEEHQEPVEHQEGEQPVEHQEEEGEEESTAGLTPTSRRMQLWAASRRRRSRSRCR